MLLDRFDKPRNLEDLRETSRDLLHKGRNHSKHKHFLTNRSSLVRYATEDNIEDYYDDLETTMQNLVDPTGHDEYDAGPSPWFDNDDCDSPNTSCRDETLTPESFPPCSSCSSPYYSSQIDNEIPAYLLEEASDSCSSSSTTSSSNKSSSTSHFHRFKSLAKRISDTSRIDWKSTKFNYESLSCYLKTCEDRDEIRQLLDKHWIIIIDAIQLRNEIDIVRDAVSLMLYLISNTLIDPETLLKMLEHGLVLVLRQVIFLDDNAFSDILTLLLKIAKYYKEAIPYMVELLVNSQLNWDLHKQLQLGETEYIKLSLEFYYNLSELLMSQFSSEACQPLIPKILLSGPNRNKQSVDNKVYRSYSTISTLVRLLDPKLTELIITTCLTRAFSHHEDIITMVYVILANTLKVVHVVGLQSETMADEHLHKWATSTLKAFHENKIYDSVKLLCNSWRRSIKSAESSEHFSQGLRAEQPASKLLSLSNQFIEFYNQYHPSLTSKFTLFGQQNNIAPALSPSSSNYCPPSPPATPTPTSDTDSPCSLFGDQWSTTSSGSGTKLSQNAT